MYLPMFSRNFLLKTTKNKISMTKISGFIKLWFVTCNIIFKGHYACLLFVTGCRRLRTIGEILSLQHFRKNYIIIIKFNSF